MTESINRRMTVLGPLPEDWEVRTIEQIATITTGSQNTQDNIPNGKYPFYVRSQQIERINKWIFDTEGVVTAGDGVGTGKVFHYVNGKFGLHQRCYLIHNFVPEVNARFFYWVFKNLFYERVHGMTAKSSVDSVRREMIADMFIPLPPIEEQKQIADALSGVDDMIEAQDEAIAKKRQIKEGLMQQLLTGKTRLPGFTEDWVDLRFEDFISRFATGLNPRSNFVLNVNASNYYITIKDFVDGVICFDHCDKVSDEAIKRINERSDLRKGDVLFSSIGRVGDAYVIEETPTNWNINESVFSLRPNPDIIDSHFLYYLIKSQDAQSKFQESITGTTLKSIKMGHLKEISCCFPSSIAEQKEIASTIRSIDREILSSETLRDKYCLIKQGMMQELLTGKTRLL